MNPVIIIVLIISLLLPAVPAVIWKKKTGVKLMPFLAGAICFFLFADILEGLLHTVVLTYTGVMSRPVLYVIYGAFAAGIFEETGRLFGFRVLLKKHKGKEISVAYGIGHGGMEVLLTLTTAYLLFIVVLSGGTLGDPSADVIYLTSAVSVTAGTAFWAVLERISAMMLHTGLSVLVYTSVRTEGKKYLYPVSILLHALADVPAAMYQTGIISSIPLIEIMMLIYAGAVLYASVKRYYIPAEKEETSAAE